MPFTMKLADFRAAEIDLTASIDLAYWFFNRDKPSGEFADYGNRGINAGWSLRIRRPGAAHMLGAFHCHLVWSKTEAPGPGTRFWCHFKSTHAGNHWKNNYLGADLSQGDAALMYNRCVLAKATWDGFNKNRPPGVATGWTELRKRVTDEGVKQLVDSGNLVKLRDLGRNDKYSLDTWDQDAWTRYMWWMAGA